MKTRTPEETSALLLRCAPWDAIDSEYERRIPFDDPSENAGLLERMVRDGSATSHRIIVQGERRGLLITRVDVGTAGRELVVVAATYDADGPKQPLSPLVADAVYQIALSEKCCAIRFHTVRPALARYVCENHGYRISEIVLRKTLT